MTVMPRGTIPGTKAEISFDHLGRPPRCVERASVGFQPPEMARVSTRICSMRPAWSRRTMRVSALRPFVLSTTVRRHTFAPARPASASNRGSTLSRGSMTAATLMPALARSAAVVQPSSVAVKMATRRPGVTPKRLR